MDSMVLDVVLKQIARDLCGAEATEDDIRLLRSRFNPRLLPDWLVTMLNGNRLAGMCFSLDASVDKSNVGAEVQWLTPVQIVSEATECEPGASVVSLGYFPIGACAEGSGDPYFLDLLEATDDPPLVRVPHDFAGCGQYPIDRIERVSDSLSEFLSKATLSGIIQAP
ncbi:hypothetical protein BRAS3843_230026 [Bradyrhizobium sp. STM 3843]|uniref:SMI1/KNR4 family protein n=1 Tax=Bradyrhizobium sp. STM 3843 TaxID=551947 RepID=UPI00024031B3|nr:SMI1/KNR4 family protein [Bradyrhizobium sp. STM 3843]CCE07625.1 hypothetical protein BRAS3843_230026 [Bradyrhizobium sp. STM 3843]